LTQQLAELVNNWPELTEWAGTQITMQCVSVSDRSAQLSSEEQTTMANFAGLRRSTYSSGRVCAGRALTSLGQRSHSIAAKSDGSARWPDGVIGSISHTDQWAIAAAAKLSHVDAMAIGVDLERIKAFTEGVLTLIAGEEERENLHLHSLSDEHAVRLFSLKESIYKCLSPVLGEFIRFHDVELLDLSSSTPRVVFHSSALETRIEPQKLELRWRRVAGHMLTLAWLRR